MMDCLLCSRAKIVHCKIILLDEQEFLHELEDSSSGQTLLDVVFRNLNLLETAYFGLRYLDQSGQTHWLDPSKSLAKLIKGCDPYTFYFGVKFYAADPCKLLEEITRYQFFLQVKQDILQERLLVPFELAAELGSYVVQSELGDYDPRRHSDGYVSEFRFLPNQTIELENRIAELHKGLVGQLPSVAELNYLEKVKWLEMYGVDLHPVLGEDNVEYFLGLTPSGIIVLRNKNAVGNYYWPRITKIYFKGRYFMLRVTDKNNDESTYGFETPSKSGCKHLWKCCVEHHAFFRLVQVTPTSPDIFALGSRFRYSGRTEKQAVRDAQIKLRTPPIFSRIPSHRYQRRTTDSYTECHTENPYGRAKSQAKIKMISVPQPAQHLMHNCTMITNMDDQRPDSPRSVKSAPWSQPHSKGLYSNSISASPRSVRSAGPRYRSSSVDSQSSNDSRSCKRRRHRNRMSDNESELSKSSNRSHRKHRRRRSKSNHRRGSESEQESCTERRKAHHQQYQLVNSDYQWQEIQRKLGSQDTSTNTIQQANVVSSTKRNSQRTSNDISLDSSNTMKPRKHRKHRSRSRSPSESKPWLSAEIKKHLAFDLVDTTGMSDSQLKEIPYTIVQTNSSKQVKIKPIWKAGESEHSPQMMGTKTGTPPPPYSPQIRNALTSQYSACHAQEFSQMLPRVFDNLTLSSNDYIPPAKERSIHNIESVSQSGFDDVQGNDHIRFSHEHTDSGLGTEHDCTYNGIDGKIPLRAIN